MTTTADTGVDDAGGFPRRRRALAAERVRRLRAVPGALQCVVPGARRRGGRPRRLQRRRQVDRGADGHGARHRDVGPRAVRRPGRHRPAGLQDRPARHGARRRRAGRVLEPDGRGEPDPYLPPARGAQQAGREPRTGLHGLPHPRASGASRWPGRCRAASSGCCRWPRCWSCRPRCSWPTSCRSAWPRSSSTRSTTGSGRSTATAPRWSWSNNRCTGCSSWPTGPSSSTTAACAYEGEPSGAGKAVETLMARREEAAASGAAEASGPTCPTSRPSLRLDPTVVTGQSAHARSDAPAQRISGRHADERASHRRRRADDVRQAGRVVGQLAPGGPPRLRLDDACWSAPASTPSGSTTSSAAA